MTTNDIRDTSIAATVASIADAAPFVDSRPTAADPVVFLIAGVVLAALISTGLVGAIVLGDGPRAVELVSMLTDPALGLAG